MAEITRKLKPFIVPNFVVEETEPRPKQEGVRQAPSHPLPEVDAQVLAELCDDFRVAVFAKAGKADPAQGKEK